MYVASVSIAIKAMILTKKFSWIGKCRPASLLSSGSNGRRGPCIAETSGAGRGACRLRANILASCGIASMSLSVRRGTMLSPSATKRTMPAWCERFHGFQHVAGQAAHVGSHHEHLQITCIIVIINDQDTGQDVKRSLFKSLASLPVSAADGCCCYVVVTMPETKRDGKTSSSK
jgi:hypothetical protein